jgi:hypothetical protein
MIRVQKYIQVSKKGALTVHYGVEEITVNVRKMFKKFYRTYLLIWRSLNVALNRSTISKYVYALNCHENYLESYVLSQSTRSLTTNI